MVNPNFRISQNYSSPLTSKFNPLPDQGFRSDVKDEFMLSWIGQLIQNNFILDQKVYKEKPADPNYNALLDIDGYEDYADVFATVRNKEHADFLKSKIDMNLGRRARLDASDRVWGPALTSILADPITYIPIPLAKGVGFTSRFLKGGLYGGGLVGASELVRRPQDPTSTNSETGMILAGSFLMSGLFAGALGRRIGDTDTPPVSKALTKKIKESGFFTKLPEKILKDQHEYNGHQPFEDTGFVWNISDSATTNTKVVMDPNFSELKNTKGKSNKIPQDKYARYDEKADIMYVNELQILSDFENGNAVFGGNGGNFLPAEVFKHPNDFKKFAMEVAIHKAVRNPWNQFQKANPEATKLEWEQYIRDIVYDDFAKRRLPGGDDLNKFNVIANTWRRFTSNVVRATGKIEDNNWYSFVLRGFADMGIKQRHNAHGIQTSNSAVVQSALRFKKITSDVRAAIQINYMKKMGLDIETGTNTSGINTEIMSKRISEFYNKIKTKMDRGEADDLYQPIEKFEREVTIATGSDVVFDQSDEFVQAAALRVRAIFKEMDEINTQLGLYDDPENFLKKQEDLTEIARTIDADIQKVTNPELKAALQENLDRVKAKLNAIVLSKKNVGKGGIKTKIVNGEVVSKKTLLQKNYIPLYPQFGKIMANLDEFKKLWFDFLSETTMAGFAPKDVKKRVDMIVEALQRTTEMGEDANILAMGDTLGLATDASTLKLGSSNFMKRSFDLDYDRLVASPIMEFYQTNISDIVIRYSNVGVKAQEIAKAYGDPFAELGQLRENHRLLMKYGKTKQGRARVRESMQKFNDLIERHYMVFNTADPTSWTKQTVEALKDYTSLVAMGGALISNLTELARPTMVHGFEKSFPLYKAWLTQNMGLFRKVLKQVHLENGEPIEIALGAMNRFLQDMGYTGQSGKLGMGFDKLTKGLNKAQVPFYWVNGMTPWTIFWKNMSSAISSHGVILDAVKLSSGKNPITKRAVSNRELKAIQARLAQYGISNENAKLIASMPFEREGNLLLANASTWDGVKGGKIAREKFRQAIQAQTENTIITPMITDTPNIIGGAITLTSDEATAILSNPLLNKIIKPIKTPYGYKVNMTWGSLPFQFMPWAFAATNKMLIAGGQALRDGEREVLANIVAMISLGGMVAYMKNPYGVQNMSNTELALEAVDRSGVLGILPDLNYTLETVSEGTTGKMVGVRNLLSNITGEDIGPRYGPQEGGDALGEFLGPGPSIPIDIIRILTGDYDYNTKHDMIRLMLPFQNLIGIEKLLKPMYSKAIEETIG